MRFISSKTHSILDYIMSILLIASPWLFGFTEGGAETILPITLGVAAMLITIMTNFEGGLIKIIPFEMHLVTDFVNGLLLAISPWIFGFADEVFLPHTILGILEIIASLTTKTSPYKAKGALI